MPVNRTADESDLMGDYPGDEVLLVKHSGAVAALPKRASRLDADQFEIVRELQRIGAEIRELEDQFGTLAEEARECRVSWSLIGFCAGLSGEGARGRYGSRE